jgi:tetratricopeptide (TPR) repeat protein
MTTCEWCHKPVVITTFNSVVDMPLSEVNKYAGSYKRELTDHPDDQTLNTSIAMCYLKLKMYDKALPAFEKAIEDNFDNSESYFYAAVCLLRGKKAFLAQRSDINKIEEFINAANMIEPRGIYHYFWAYIKQDFFERKYLNTSPSYKECLINAERLGTSQYDKDKLFELLGVPKPAGF